MTFPEFVAFDDASDGKHELVDGEAYAMAGGTIEHGRLAMALGAALAIALREKRCTILSSDVRVRVRKTGLVTYPDLTIVCGRLETDPDDDQTVTNPVVLVEVLSDSTEAYDRGAKWAHYRRLPSLKEYVLVSQRERLVEVFRRNEEGIFELREWHEGEVVELASIEARIAVDEIYANPLAGTDG